MNAFAPRQNFENALLAQGPRKLDTQCLPEEHEDMPAAFMGGERA